MVIFCITDDNNITVFASVEEAVQAGTSDATRFDSQAGLSELSTAWPMSRFVDVYNGIAGHGEIQKFANRKQAVKRIWDAIQPLTSQAATEPVLPADTTGSGASPARKAKSGGEKKAAKRTRSDIARGDKKAAVIAMMKRGHGVALATIMRATGWQAHTVRGRVLRFEILDDRFHAVPLC